MGFSKPLKIVGFKGPKALVKIDGDVVEVDTSLLENPGVGDYILVHDGLAIQKLDEENAVKTLDMIRDLQGG